MPKTILIVEDEDSLRALLVEKLKSSGFSTIEAVDGQDCLEKLKTTTPNLILLDVIMPNKDGMEVLYTLMQDTKNKDIPVVVLSNKSDFGTTLAALNYGAVKFMIKANSSMESIVQTINEILHEGQP
ncbi:MAG TPA: response regulator [Candidatus Saccharimonadales bacterium]|nr:response regulator [Candidatus Saccharimonadales bacterium]